MVVIGFRPVDMINPVFDELVREIEKNMDVHQYGFSIFRQSFRHGKFAGRRHTVQQNDLIAIRQFLFPQK